MTNNNIPMRNRPGPIRPRMNGDENATSRHVRQASSVALSTRPSHPTVNVQALKNGLGPQRAALGEVTTTAVNRKDAAKKLAGKEPTEIGLKRKSSALVTGPQRVPIRAARTTTAQTTARIRPTIPTRTTVLHEPIIAIAQDEEEDEMDVEDHHVQVQPTVVDTQIQLVSQDDIESMMGVELEEQEPVDGVKPVRHWPEVGTDRAERYRKTVDQVREVFQDELEDEDATMVSEYANEIFDYMNELEDECMPNPEYMTGQSEITWPMRQTLVDWLLQVHLRYHMLPETLWIAINIVDRFLTRRVVSLVKLQLVGVTAMFIAAKYEEILAPSVDEFVFMTERGYTKEEILKGERIMLQTLEFKVSHYCSPYSWMRKISKADAYDLNTRTLCKFLTEVTLLDYRFLRVKPSMVAAIGMYTARRMLGGDWNEAFVYHAGYTEEHLLPGHAMLVQKLTEETFTKQYVFKKYAHKKFLKASLFAVEWALTNFEEEGNMENMVLEE
ncbi:unnamed protein product [Somion occarium]|uniref:Cyclin N-terminal domain-containing protein n=1 Tax=Somion occarium TaxID=3059160 RepID=A0ABP1E956_9APHY